MLASFFEWTTHLNQTNPLAFAVVTVLTMASVGGAIAMTAELLLTRMSGGKPSAPDHHPSGH